MLEEAPSARESSSPYWFLDSGARFSIENGIGGTVQGALAADDPWRDLYAQDNPSDTDGGRHPQNIFRLITKKSWTNVRMQVEFKILRDNLSGSPNRNESNGILIMERYQDQNTLYYGGLRVDGTAVIKKKYRGEYYTLAQEPVFPGSYDPTDRPDLLPHGFWISLRFEAVTNADGSVSLRLYRGIGDSWSLIASAIDDGQYGGTPPITTSGFAGIRTDFMDVLFRDLRIQEL